MARFIPVWVLRLISDLDLPSSFRRKTNRCFCSKMAVLLETLNLRNLLAFAFLLLCILITFFVIGGKIGECEKSIFHVKICGFRKRYSVRHLFHWYYCILPGCFDTITWFKDYCLSNSPRTCCLRVILKG